MSQKAGRDRFLREECRRHGEVWRHDAADPERRFENAPPAHAASKAALRKRHELPWVGGGFEFTPKALNHSGTARILLPAPFIRAKSPTDKTLSA